MIIHLSIGTSNRRQPGFASQLLDVSGEHSFGNSSHIAVRHATLAIQQETGRQGFHRAG